MLGRDDRRMQQEKEDDEEIKSLIRIIVTVRLFPQNIYDAFEV